MPESVPRERRIHDPRFETIDREALRAYQTARIRALVGKAWVCNPFYRRHWSQAGLKDGEIDSLEAFSASVPLVEKADFVADQDRFPPFGSRHEHCLTLGEQYFASLTSGTSGQGVEVHLQLASEMPHTLEMYAYQYTWAGVLPGSLTFLTMPVTMMAGGRIEYEGARSYGLSICAVGSYDAGRKLELMRRFTPVALIGTTSYFGHLAAVAEDRPPSPGVGYLFTGGEGAGIAYLERLEQDFGARVYDRYGSTQSGNDHMFSCEYGIGTPDRPGMLHNIEPLVLFEVVDTETGRHVEDGETGEIVVTSLYHLDTPLIRWRSGDQAVYRSYRSCPCGRPFAGIDIATISRVDDMRKIKGVNVWPQSVENAVFSENIAEDFEVLLKSDGRGSDVALLRLMPKYALDEVSAVQLAERVGVTLRRHVGISFDVEILAPASLPRSEFKARRWKDERVHKQTS